MCLNIIHNQNKFIAGYDITCYKVLGESKSPKDPSRTAYYSPVMHMGYELGSTYFNGEVEQFETSIWGDEVLVNGGFYHTFLNLEDAKEYAYDNSYSGGYSGYAEGHTRPMVVVECVIPKGTVYYQGVTALCKDSYASRALRITDKIVYRTCKIVYRAG